MFKQANGQEMERIIVQVVDDDASVRASVSWLLESVGMKVIAFENAESFWEHANFVGVGCILLDVRMPFISGFDLYQRLSNEVSTMPIIFLSGYGNIPTAVRALKNGAFDFIEKPYNDQVLIDTVNGAIRLSSEMYAGHITSQDQFKKMALLTDRERDVFARIIEGKQNKIIAKELNISLRTVEVHRAHIRDKLGARSIVDMVRISKNH